LGNRFIEKLGELRRIGGGEPAREAAAVVDGKGTFKAATPAEVPVIDTVVADDAFCAVFILGLVKGWTAERSLERAVEIAATVWTVHAPPR